MRANDYSRVRFAWQEGNYPLTKWIILINVITLVAAACGAPVDAWLGFNAPGSLARPWTLFTYPFVSLDPIGLLFYGLWLYFVGGSLERSWGTAFFAKYFAAISVITAVGMSIGATIILGTSGTPINLTNLVEAQIYPVTDWLPIAALMVAWCMLNADELIYLMGIIPILAKYLAVGEVLYIFFIHARMHPLMGVFALSGCFASFLWVRTRAWSEISLYSTMPVTHQAPKPPKVPRGPRDDDFTWRDLNPFEWIARRRRKKQFMRLWQDEDLPGGDGP